MHNFVAFIFSFSMYVQHKQNKSISLADLRVNLSQPEILSSNAGKIILNQIGGELSVLCSVKCPINVNMSIIINIECLHYDSSLRSDSFKS